MQKEMRAIQVAVASAVVGAVTKLVVGSMTGSMSMISSAADSIGDIFVSLANMLVIRIAHSEPDEDHNYGHAKAEGLGAMFEGGFIFAAGVFIIYGALHKWFTGDVAQDTTLGIYVMLPLLATTAGTVLYLRKVARETGSLVIKSDALHYAVDIWVGLGVLLSLILVKLTGMLVFDLVVSVAIALYMLYSSAHIVRQGVDVVMDRSLDAGTVTRLKSLLGTCAAIESFHDFKTRAGTTPHVDFHVVVRPDMTARQLHDLFLALQAQVRAVVGPATKVLMHADPDEAQQASDAAASPVLGSG